MTREEAEAKAARLTAAGVPTGVVKDTRKPGGYVTRDRKKHRSAGLRFNRSEKGLARNRRYERTIKRLKSKRERAQVRHERAAHNEIIALAGGI